MQQVYDQFLNLYVGRTIAKDIYLDTVMVAPEGSILTPELVKKLHSYSALIKSGIYLTDDPKVKFKYDKAFFDKLDNPSIDSMLVIEGIVRSKIKNTDDFFEKNKVIRNQYQASLKETSSKIITTGVATTLDKKAVKTFLDACDRSDCSNVAVAIISAMMAFKAKCFTPEIIYDITMGALFFDVGLLSIPDNGSKIMLTSDHNMKNLTKEEFKEYITYPVLGFELLDKMSEIPNSIKKIVLFHRVWEDAKGSYDKENLRYDSFPLNYRGYKVTQSTKNLAISIVQTAVSFVHMIHGDNYKKYTIDEAVEYIYGNSDRIYGRGAKILHALFK